MSVPLGSVTLFQKSLVSTRRVRLQQDVRYSISQNTMAFLYIPLSPQPNSPLTMRSFPREHVLSKAMVSIALGEDAGFKDEIDYCTFADHSLYCLLYHWNHTDTTGVVTRNLPHLSLSLLLSCAYYCRR